MSDENNSTAMAPEQLEKYSSAITLSDMEIFVFPELMYSLVLANIMSPIIWSWRDRDCFKKLEGKTSYRKLMRLKQFIIDEFEFNLDLETWGLTSKAREIERFKTFVSAEQIAQSNALFGYHGDKYYFDVDIRRHFGLDKYDEDIIPYWKTETIEAMSAFHLKEGYKAGAGECVSLAALYVAAAFVVCEIPLDDIYMILTPLHSQNFIDLRGGILTNNRRLVTKNMWFNGTAISNKAQRALRNENVTIVAHNSGYVHCLYDDATIDERLYETFTYKLDAYLTSELSLSGFASFLRTNQRYQKFFQVCRDCRGHPQFIKAEVLFHYEHGSNYRVGDKTFERLLEEVSDEDFDLRKAESRSAFQEFIRPVIPDSERFVNELADFLHTEANLPGSDKSFLPSEAIDVKVGQSREEIIDYLESQRQKNFPADLAFYAFRDMSRCQWGPFVKAAVERNPVSLRMTESMSVDEVYEWLGEMPDQSIYDGQRLAQPDEVANFQSGDGIEKAFLLANVIRDRGPSEGFEIIARGNEVILEVPNKYKFTSAKSLDFRISIGMEEIGAAT